MLFMTLLPSNTTAGMDAKLEFFSASTSLTPSPVIATVLPDCLSDLTRMDFCSGDTRPKTVYLSAISAVSFKDNPSNDTALL